MDGIFRRIWVCGTFVPARGKGNSADGRAWISPYFHLFIHICNISKINLDFFAGEKSSKSRIILQCISQKIYNHVLSSGVLTDRYFSPGCHGRILYPTVSVRVDEQNIRFYKGIRMAENKKCVILGNIYEKRMLCINTII